MTFGITATGYNRKTFTDMLDEVQTRMRALFGAPRLDITDPKGALASVVHPLIDELSEVHEILEIIYNTLDAQRATGQAYSAGAALSGVLRKLATVGTHVGMTFVFDSAVAGTIARGDVRFNPVSDPDNVWINSEDFTIGSSGSYVIPVESETPGSSKTFAALTTVEIIDGPSELSSITVPTDAIPGTDLETEVAWRARREASLQAQGTTPVDALTAEVEAVDGVVNARVIESPGYIRVVVADGGGDADDDELAQAIWDGKAGGVITLGDVQGNATDAYGETQIINFDRATEVTIHAEIEVTAPEGASATEIRNALKAAMPTRSGDPVIWSKLFAAGVSVDGVDDVTLFEIGTTDPPGSTANISVSDTELAVLEDANIDVTVNP